MRHFLHFLLIALFSITTAAADESASHGTKGGHQFAVGEPAKGKADKTVRVSMRDNMRFVFTPQLESLHHGEVVRFSITNDGKIPHEFSIGNAMEQKMHAEEMRKMASMSGMSGMAHKDPNTASLQPGESAEIVWRFKGKDTVVFSCNIPGHFEAGMRHDVAIH